MKRIIRFASDTHSLRALESDRIYYLNVKYTTFGQFIVDLTHVKHLNTMYIQYKTSAKLNSK